MYNTDLQPILKQQKIYKYFYEYHLIDLLKLEMTRKELANLYGVSESTFRIWLRGINFSPDKRRLTPKDLQIILQEFGNPSIYNEFKSPKMQK